MVFYTLLCCTYYVRIIDSMEFGKNINASFKEKSLKKLKLKKYYAEKLAKQLV